MRLTKMMIVPAGLSLLLLTAGCTSDAGSAASATGTGQSASANLSSGISIPEKPARNFDVEGQVKQIRGNQVTVLKIVKTEEIVSEEEKASRREQMQSLSPEERAAVKAERVKVTSETFDFTIPVGIRIVSNRKTGDNLEIQYLNIADIRQGYTLKIWFAEGSTDEVVFIQAAQSE